MAKIFCTYLICSVIWRALAHFTLASPCKVYRLVEDGVEQGIVLFNANNLIHAPTEVSAPVFVSPGQAYITHWAYDAWFYLAFTPVNRRLNRSVLAIDYQPYNVPVNRVDLPRKHGKGELLMWELDHDWCRKLVANQRAIMTIVGELTAFGNITLPIDLRLHKFSPDKWLSERHEDRRSAVSRAMRVQNVLHTQLAFVSMLACLCTTPEDLKRPMPRWRDHLSWKCNDHDDSPLRSHWLAALDNTWVFDFSHARIGAWVDICQPAAQNTQTPCASTTWFSLLPRMVDVGHIPIALYYRSPDIPTNACDIAKKYAPDVIDPAPITPDSPPPRPDSPTPPPLPRHFERYGPTAAKTMGFPQWLDALREVEFETYVRLTDEQRVRRQEREARNADHPIPGKRGPSVFQWMKCFWNDTWTCNNVSQTETTLTNLWGETVKSQRIYSAFLNEWHISTDLPMVGLEEPANVTTYEEEYGWEYSEAQDIARPASQNLTALANVPAPRADATAASSSRARSQSPPRRAMPTTSQPVASTSSAVPRRSESKHEVALAQLNDDDLYAPPDSFDVIVRKRWGVVVPTDPNWFDPTRHEQNVDLLAVKRILGWRPQHHADFSQFFWEMMWLFVDTLKEKGAVVNGELRRPRGFGSYDDIARSGLVERIPSDNAGHSGFVIVRKNVGDREVYLMRRRGGSVDYSANWYIVVEDPLTALEIVRRNWGPVAVDLAHELMLRGIPFHTVLLQDAPPTVSEPEPGYRLGLGMFPQGYKPNSLDYQMYELRRDELLRRGGHMRAALMRGGILWRLAISCLGIDCLIDGPSSDAMCPYVLNIGDKFGVDDDLSQAEVDIICGVCRVQTCKFHYWLRSAPQKLIFSCSPNR